MNKEHLQSILKWGENAIKVATAGKMESAHIDDMFLGGSYSKEMAVENCFSAMDYLVESFADDLVFQNIIVMAVIHLQYKDYLAIDLPDPRFLINEIESPPEIYFMPYMHYLGLKVCKEFEEHIECLTVKSGLNNKYDDKKLFSYYSCWRDEEAIKSNWIEYERGIFRVFDPTGKVREMIISSR